MDRSSSHSQKISSTFSLKPESESITIPIFVESRYRVNRKKIKERVKGVIRQQGLMGAVEVSIAIVGNRKMQSLNKKYRNIDKPTNVLSFPQNEGPYSVQPKDHLFLGDIIISYPVVIEEASRYNKLVDEWIAELVEHGLLHLLGQHHR